MGHYKNEASVLVKGCLITFFACMVIIYLIFGFIAWGWDISEWYWPIRMIHIAISIYMAYYYHELIGIIYEKITSESNND